MPSASYNYDKLKDDWEVNINFDFDKNLIRFRQRIRDWMW